MRTTLDINDALLAKAKAVAAQEQTSLSRLMEEGLVLRLRSQAGRSVVARRYPSMPGAVDRRWLCERGPWKRCTVRNC
jgi:hypothetical protein